MADLKRALRDLKDQVKDAAEHGEAVNVNVAGRTNIASAVNVGGEGEQHSVSSTQTTRIRQQRNGETIEETTETRHESASQ